MATIVPFGVSRSDAVHKNSRVLELLMEHRDKSFYIFVGICDNPSIKQPAFLKLHKDLKQELIVNLNKKPYFQFTCMILHPIDVVNEGEEKRFLEFTEMSNPPESLPERIYTLDKFKPLLTPKKLTDLGHSPEWARMILANQQRSTNLLKNYIAPGVTLTQVSLSLDSLFVGDCLETNKSQIGVCDIEVQLCLYIRNKANKNKELNVNTYGAYAERLIYEECPNIKMGSVKRICEVARPDRLRRRHWNKS